GAEQPFETGIEPVENRARNFAGRDAELATSGRDETENHQRHRSAGDEPPPPAPSSARGGGCSVVVPRSRGGSGFVMLAGRSHDSTAGAVAGLAAGVLTEIIVGHAHQLSPA